jgi:hypothetical protein
MGSSASSNKKNIERKNGEYNEKAHKKEIKIKKKKIDDIINFLDEKYKNKFIHLSDKPISIDDFKNSNKINESWLGGKVYCNPTGLWFSCGSNWIKWVQKWNTNYTSRWTNAKYIYEIEDNKESVLHIKSYKELLKFHKKYAKYTEKDGYHINWQIVKKEYDGLVICPYLGDKIWDKINGYNVDSFRIFNTEYQYIKGTLGKNIMKYPEFYLEWYRHWETSTGVIWRKNGIVNIKLIKDLTEN